MRKDKFTIKPTLEKLVSEGKSTHQISQILKINDGTLMRWMREWKITPNHYKQITINGILHKRCPRCKEIKEINKQNFKPYNPSWCSLCVSKNCHDRQKSFKEKAVLYKGGKCSQCGYNKCFGALDFHHVNPSEKDFEINIVRWKKWDIIKKELDKCICLCRNCHAEEHFYRLDGE
jgi:hypothetical protein